MGVKPAVILAIARGLERCAEILLDRADVDLIAFYDKGAELLRARGIPCIPFSGFLPDAARTRVVNEAARRAKAAGLVLFSREFRNAWREYDDAFLDELAGETCNLMRTGFFECIRIAETLRRCVNQCDVRLVVAPHDICRDTRTLIGTARRYGVSALHVCHGFPYSGVNSILLREPALCDRIAVYSERLRDLYRSLGVPAERLVVTGNPDWDVYARVPVPGHKEYVCETLGLEPHRPIIVYGLTYTDRLSPSNLIASGYVNRITEDVVAAFAELSRRHPDWQFVLRPHPNDPDAPKNLAEMAAARELYTYCIDVMTSPVSCLTSADVFICTHSNMGIEAVLAGKVVVNYVPETHCRDLFNEGVGPLFDADDAPIPVSEYPDLPPAIEAALLDETTRAQFFAARPATIRRFNAVNDGRAAHRVCELVMEMMESGPAGPCVDRYPEYEPALARAMPEAARQIAVIGAAAGRLRQHWEGRGAMRIVTAEDIDQVAESGFDAVVFTEPLLRAWGAAAALDGARRHIREQGAILAIFLNCASPEARCDTEAGHWAPPRPGGAPSSQAGEFLRAELEELFRSNGMYAARVTALTHSDAGDVFEVDGVFDGLPVPDMAVTAWVVCLTPVTG